MTALVGRALRGGRRSRQIAASNWRAAALQAMFPGLQLENAFIGPGCDIHLGEGAHVTIRGCVLTRGVMLTASAGAMIDLQADYVGPGSVIVARKYIGIGEGSKVAEMVVVRDANHDRGDGLPLSALKYKATAITIGFDVWLGARATVLQGVTVGDGATIGAGSVVTHDVAPRATVVGLPARPIAIKCDGP